MFADKVLAIMGKHFMPHVAEMSFNRRLRGMGKKEADFAQGDLPAFLDAFDVSRLGAAGEAVKKELETLL